MTPCGVFSLSSDKNRVTLNVFFYLGAFMTDTSLLDTATLFGAPSVPDFISNALPSLKLFLDDNNRNNQLLLANELDKAPCDFLGFNTEIFSDYFPNDISIELGDTIELENELNSVISTFFGAPYKGINFKTELERAVYEKMYSYAAKIRDYIFIEGENCGKREIVTVKEWYSRPCPLPISSNIVFNEIINKVKSGSFYLTGDDARSKVCGPFLSRIKGLRPLYGVSPKSVWLNNADGIHLARSLGIVYAALIRQMNAIRKYQAPVCLIYIEEGAYLIGRVEGMLLKPSQGGNTRVGTDTVRMSAVGKAHKGLKNYSEIKPGDDLSRFISKAQLKSNLREEIQAHPWFYKSGKKVEATDSVVNKAIKSFELLPLFDKRKYIFG